MILGLVLMVFAVARLTRLITDDRIFDAPRNGLLRVLVRRGGEDSMLAYLVVCGWCVSIYTGALGALAWAVWGDQLAFHAVCAALAASHITGLLNTTIARGD